MKKHIFLLLAVLLIGVGCAAVKQGTVDAKTCLADPVCREEAVKQANSAKQQAVAVAGVSPLPGSANVAGGVAYGVVLLIALVRGGRKLRPAEEANTPSSTKVE
jgi:hypothetical protein